MIGTKLKSLVDNAQDFKGACEVKVSDEKLPEKLDTAIKWGEELQESVEAILVHMRNIKERLGACSSIKTRER